MPALAEGGGRYDAQGFVKGSHVADVPMTQGLFLSTVQRQIACDRQGLYADCWQASAVRGRGIRQLLTVTEILWCPSVPPVLEETLKQN